MGVEAVEVVEVGVLRVVVIVLVLSFLPVCRCAHLVLIMTMTGVDTAGEGGSAPYVGSVTVSAVMAMSGAVGADGYQVGKGVQS